MLIDVHCHLDLLEDVEGAVERAKEAGVGIIVANGVNYESNKKVLEFAKKFNIVKAGLGIYPIDALKMSDSGIEKEIRFIKLMGEDIAAIGEVGIDFKESDERKKQEENFLKFIKLAKELNKVIIVHSRNAEEKCIEILEKMMAEKVVMHCFCGSLKLIKRIIENSWFLSIPTSINYSEQFQQLVKETPIDSLLCESDSPFLHPLRQRNNEPSNIIYSYKKIAEIKGISLEDAERKIESNFKRMFGY